MCTCYEIGVRVTSAVASSMPLVTSVSWRRPDGAPCWSMETTTVSQGVATVSLKDGRGTVVGTGTYDMAMGSFNITCDGRTYDLLTSGCFPRPAEAGAGSPVRCAKGTCR